MACRSGRESFPVRSELGSIDDRIEAGCAMTGLGIPRARRVSPPSSGSATTLASEGASSCSPVSCALSMRLRLLPTRTAAMPRAPLRSARPGSDRFGAGRPVNRREPSCARRLTYPGRGVSNPCGNAVADRLFSTGKMRAKLAETFFCSGGSSADRRRRVGEAGHANRDLGQLPCHPVRLSKRGGCVGRRAPAAGRGAFGSPVRSHTPPLLPAAQPPEWSVVATMPSRANTGAVAIGLRPDGCLSSKGGARLGRQGWKGARGSKGAPAYRPKTIRSAVVERKPTDSRGTTAYTIPIPVALPPARQPGQGRP